ncbi:hypothetical protein PIB30_001470 [Stylosanthes scabra]|uniref:F-box associated beta-propeller type 1 domain-containing protein n=1 Tax=Stylosanthes scabra TaxID=79078 RepID=A0ABU6Q3I5_9FABA|nr:hypothetical protein [Stylosanthes scabra]
MAFCPLRNCIFNTLLFPPKDVSSSKILMYTMLEWWTLTQSSHLNSASSAMKNRTLFTQRMETINRLLQRFSYYCHIVRNVYPVEKTWNSLKPLRITLLSGFGYDESKDDYLVIAAWKDKKEENHFDFYSLRTNSWKSLEVALPNKPRRRDPGLFFNGAFHWLPEDVNDDTILVFDIKKKELFGDTFARKGDNFLPCQSGSFVRVPSLVYHH